MRISAGTFLGCAALAAVTGGCILSSPPKPKSWVVTAQRKPAAEVSVSKSARLGMLSVAAPYDKPALTVRRSDGSVAFDSYNVFATSPSVLLRAPLTALLEGDGRFGRVLPTSSSAKVDSTLEAVVNDLALDCREEGKRTARVSISLVVMENREVKMILDGEGAADAEAGDYSAAYSEAFANAVSTALGAYPAKQ